MARQKNSFLLFLLLAPLFSFAEMGEVADSYAATYFVPASVPTLEIWRMRTPDGVIRRFDGVKGKCARMESMDGWTATVATDIENAWVQTPPNEHPALKIAYKCGAPVSVTVDGKTRKLAESSQAADTNGAPAWVSWPADWDRDPYSEFSTSMWRSDGRLQLWFKTGNRAGAFLAMILLLGLSLTLALKRVPCRIVAAALPVMALVGVFLTQSRGALVAALVALGTVAVCWLHGRGWLSRKRLLIALAVIVLLCVVVGLLFVLVLPRGIASYIRSDGLRWEMLRGFPRMMCDAPWGWGRGMCGPAYADWYCTPDEWRYFASLFSDHLSFVADFGWLGGAFYLLGWLGGLAALMRLAWVGGPTAPLGVWLVLAVAACFNPILHARTMLYLPLAALAPLALDRRWLRWGFWVKPIIAGALLTAVILLTVWMVGRSVSFAPQIVRQGSAVLVNGDDPRIWLVADDDVLGSRFMPKEEIRWFYWANPNAPALGFVRGLDGLRGQPGVRRLVLSGRHCADYLRRFRDREDGLVIPPEIVFMSPGFVAPEIPRQLHERSRVTVVAGEFAARYDSNFGRDPLTKTVLVKGSELYILGWMRYFMPLNEWDAMR